LSEHPTLEALRSAKEKTAAGNGSILFMRYTPGQGVGW